MSPIFLKPDEGRTYPCGPMRAVFKADEGDNGAQYSISEWWLGPHSDGPGAHSHDANHDIFYVLEGVASFRLGEEWIDAPKGSFFAAPPGVNSRFRQPDGRRVSLLNIYILAASSGTCPPSSPGTRARRAKAGPTRRRHVFCRPGLRARPNSAGPSHANSRARCCSKPRPSSPSSPASSAARWP